MSEKRFETFISLGDLYRSRDGVRRVNYQPLSLVIRLLNTPPLFPILLFRPIPLSVLNTKIDRGSTKNSTLYLLYSF